MEFRIPHSMEAEHEELHHELEKAILSGGKTGTAAREVAEALHIHFESEEKYALPPLGLLPALAEGKIDAEKIVIGGVCIIDRLCQLYYSDNPIKNHGHNQIAYLTYLVLFTIVLVVVDTTTEASGWK